MDDRRWWLWRRLQLRQVLLLRRLILLRLLLIRRTMHMLGVYGRLSGRLLLLVQTRSGWWTLQGPRLWLEVAFITKQRRNAAIK